MQSLQSSKQDNTSGTVVVPGETKSAAAELNFDQQALAKKNLFRFYWLNGISVTLVMENILMLWALRNEVGAPLAAVISSFTFLSMPFMFLGKTLSARMGLIRAWSLCWSIRYLFVLAMVPVPWLLDSNWAPAAPWIITFCTFALFALRSMGMINSVPVLGAVTDRYSLGSFQGGASMRGQIAYFATMIIVILVLRWRDTVGAFQILLTIGCLNGFVSAFFLRKTPEPPNLRLSARLQLKQTARMILKKTSFRRLTLAWCAASTVIVLVAPMTMLVIKKGYGLADNTALGFTLIELCGTILAAWTISIIADHTGPRPLIILSICFLLGMAGFWALAPVEFVPAAVALAFLATGVAKSALTLALSHYLLASSNTEERMGLSIFIQMSAGAASGLTGAFLAGGLLKCLSPYFGDGIELYQAYYRIVFSLCLLLIIPAFLLPHLKDWTVRNVIGLIFSFNDLRALDTLNRLRRDTSDDEEVKHIDQLSNLASHYSEPHLREFLQSGRLGTRARAMAALDHIRFGAETAAALIREVRDGEFTNGWRAAELLGRRGIITNAIPTLRQGLRSEDPFLAGKCMVALARMKAKEAYPEICVVFAGSANPRVVIHGAAAMEIMRAHDNIRLLLEKCIEHRWPPMVLDEVLLAIAALCGRKRQLYRYFKLSRETDDKRPESPPRQPATVANPGIEQVWAFLSRHPFSTLPPRIAAALQIIAS